MLSLHYFDDDAFKGFIEMCGLFLDPADFSELTGNGYLTPSRKGYTALHASLLKKWLDLANRPIFPWSVKHQGNQGIAGVGSPFTPSLLAELKQLNAELNSAIDEPAKDLSRLHSVRDTLDFDSPLGLFTQLTPHLTPESFSAFDGPARLFLEQNHAIRLLEGGGLIGFSQPSHEVRVDLPEVDETSEMPRTDFSDLDMSVGSSELGGAGLGGVGLGGVGKGALEKEKGVEKVDKRGEEDDSEAANTSATSILAPKSPEDRIRPPLSSSRTSSALSSRLFPRPSSSSTSTSQPLTSPSEKLSATASIKERLGMDRLKGAAAEKKEEVDDKQEESSGLDKRLSPSPFGSNAADKLFNKVQRPRTLNRGLSSEPDDSTDSDMATVVEMDEGSEADAKTDTDIKVTNTGSKIAKPPASFGASAGTPLSGSPLSGGRPPLGSKVSSLFAERSSRLQPPTQEEGSDVTSGKGVSSGSKLAASLLNERLGRSKKIEPKFSASSVLGNADDDSNTLPPEEGKGGAGSDSLDADFVDLSDFENANTAMHDLSAQSPSQSSFDSTTFDPGNLNKVQNEAPAEEQMSSLVDFSDLVDFAESSSFGQPKKDPAPSYRSDAAMRASQKLRGLARSPQAPEVNPEKQRRDEITAQLQQLNEQRARLIKEDNWEGVVELFQARLDLFAEGDDRQKVYLSLANIYQQKLKDDRGAMNALVAAATENLATEVDTPLELLHKVGLKAKNLPEYVAWLNNALQQPRLAAHQHLLRRHLSDANAESGNVSAAFFTRAALLLEDPSNLRANDVATLTRWATMCDLGGDLANFFFDIEIDKLPEEQHFPFAYEAGSILIQLRESLHAVPFLLFALDSARDQLDTGNIDLDLLTVAVKELVQIYHVDNNWHGIVSVVDEWIDVIPPHSRPELRSSLDEAFARDSALPDVIDRYLNTYKQNPNNINNITRLAQLYANKGQPQEAVALLRDSYKAASNAQRPAILLQLAYIAEHNVNQGDAALDYYKQINHIHPCVESHKGAARLFHERRDWNGVVQSINYLIEHKDEIHFEERIAYINMGLDAANALEDDETYQTFVIAMNDV